ncbi:MAG: outer membrane protein assembly factor BamB family protein [Steroidobacteraceae bacterium]
MALLAAACLLLASCGGGSSSGAGNYSGASVTVNPASVALTTSANQTAQPTATVQVDVNTASPAQKTYTTVTYTLLGINSVSPTTSSSNSFTLTINFLSPAQLQGGSYDDTLKISTCYDPQCAHEIEGSPVIVPVTYNVTRAAPTITTVQPTSALVNGPAFTLQVSGAHFTSQSLVIWNGSALATTFVSSTSLTAQVTAADITTPGVVAITVLANPYDLSGSNTFDFTVIGPTVTSISPSAALLGSGAFTLSVTGNVFTTDSVVEWNGAPLATTFVSATQLTARVPGTDLLIPGSMPVSVVASAGESSASPPADFTVHPPAGLTLDSVSPAVLEAGGPAFTLTLLGYGFTSSSVAQWNGSARVTTYVSPEELLAQISASDIATVGSATVTVRNTSTGVTSDSIPVTLAPPTKDAVALQENPAHTGAIEFNSVSLPTSSTWSVNVGGNPSYALIADGKVFLTVDVFTSTGESSQLVALNQTNGATVWGPIPFDSLVNATYDDGTVFALSTPAGGWGPATLLAYDASTGALKWSTPLSLQSLGDFAPAAANGTVFAGLSSSFPDALYAVDETTGAIDWVGAVTDGSGSSPAVTADGVYISDACNGYDFRPATGESIWTTGTGCSYGGNAPPAVSNGVLFLSGGPNGSEFDAGTGASEGTYAADTLPAFSSSTGYFLRSGTLQAINLSSGAVLWSFTGDGQLATAPIVVNQYVFIGSTSGNLYALAAATGTVVWQQSLGAPIPIGPEPRINGPLTGLAAGDGLLVVPAGNSVTAYTLSTSP